MFSMQQRTRKHSAFILQLSENSETLEISSTLVQKPYQFVISEFQACSFRRTGFFKFGICSQKPFDTAVQKICV